MINFIICEDEPELLNIYQQQIDKFMMKYDIDYTCYTFDRYNNKWKRIIKSVVGFKIYLLDIKTGKDQE